MSVSQEKIFNARQMHFSSILSVRQGLPPSDGNEAHSFDELLDAHLGKHMLERLKIGLSQSKKKSSTIKKRLEKDRVEKLNILQEMRKKEHDQFVKSLYEGDDWERRVEEYANTYSLLTENDESSDDSIEQAKQNIHKKISKAEMIEEVSKCLLMGCDVDYLQDDEACSVLLNNNS